MVKMAFIVAKVYFVPRRKWLASNLHNWRDHSGPGGIGGFSLYLFIARAIIQSGSHAVSFINIDMRFGKLYTFLLRSSARTMRQAALSASMTNGMWNSLTAVIGVLTNPGQIVVTAIFRSRN